MYFDHNNLTFLLPKVQEQDLDALYTETNTFRLASHLYWALWALIQVNTIKLLLVGFERHATVITKYVL